MEQKEWIVLNYTLPREPSRARVSVWRRLKKIGAVNMQQSMWILPLTDENYNQLSEIKQEVSQNKGDAFVMQSAVDEKSKEIIIERFQAARDEEYRELLEQCDDFFKEIEKETGKGKFTFAEIEENEEELSKLKQWYEKIAARDFFEAPLKEKSKEMLSSCADLLEEFCQKVYAFIETV